MATFPPPHIVVPTEAHTYTIIFLHGRSSSGPKLAEELEIHTSPLTKELPNWKWTFPSSRMRLSTVFQEEMQEWFDIYSLTDPEARSELQVEGLTESVEYVLGLVQDSIAELGGDASKVVLGGISMGMATALSAFLAHGNPLGGVIGASGWLPSMKARALLGSTLGEEEEGIKRTPVWIGHGINDSWVNVGLGRLATDKLIEMGMKDVTWMKYTIIENDGHWFKEPEEFEDIVRFLKEEVMK